MVCPVGLVVGLGQISIDGEELGSECLVVVEHPGARLAGRDLGIEVDEALAGLVPLEELVGPPPDGTLLAEVGDRLAGQGEIVERTRSLALEDAPLDEALTFRHGGQRRPTLRP